MQITQTAILALLTTSITTATATSAPPPTTPPAKIPSQDHVLVNLIAYEFPYCLASQSNLLQNLFVSRPTDTKLVATSSSSSGQKTSSECEEIHASKGVPHSFFYTADGAVEGCELRTFEQVGCEGEVTVRALEGFSTCFTKPEKYVKPLLKSAMVVCGV